MCTVCGCTEGTPTTKHSRTNDAKSHERYNDHVRDSCDGHSPPRRPAHHQAHGIQPLPSGGAGSADSRVGGMSGKQVIEIERDILGKNNGIAAVNRALFLADDVLVFNLLSSPGAGKTTLLVRAASELKRSRPVGVIEATSRPRTTLNVFRLSACQPFKSIPARIVISMLQ